MARKRSNHSRRFQPATERSYHEYLVSVPAPTTSRAEIVRLLRGGEDTYLELKVKFSNVEKLTAEIIALANTDGGAIVFGVNDQLRIEGVDDPENVEAELREICARHIQPPVFPYIKKVAFDNGRRIVMLEVEPNRRPHHTNDYQFFLREGAIKRETTREELTEIYGKSPRIRFEQIPLFKAKISDIDESLFWSFVRGINPVEWEANDKGFPTAQVMTDFGLAARYLESSLPTFGGLLLFGLHEKVLEKIPQAKITITRFAGNNAQTPVIETAMLQGNLLRMFDGALSFIKRYIDLREIRPPRKAATEEEAQLSRASYHEKSVLESIANFFVHRDWSNTEKIARINIYEDSIEFINPAQHFESSTHSIRYGISQPPNPLLKTILTNSHYGVPLAYGGVPMIFSEGNSFAKKNPEGASINGHEFRIRIFGWR